MRGQSFTASLNSSSVIFSIRDLTRSLSYLLPCCSLVTWSWRALWSASCLTRASSCFTIVASYLSSRAVTLSLSYRLSSTSVATLFGVTSLSWLPWVFIGFSKSWNVNFAAFSFTSWACCWSKIKSWGCLGSETSSWLLLKVCVSLVSSIAFGRQKFLCRPQSYF